MSYGEITVIGTDLAKSPEVISLQSLAKTHIFTKW